MIASLYAACATGLQYLTAVFSDALKSEVGLSQNDIETIGVATQCSGCSACSRAASLTASARGARSSRAGSVQACALLVYYLAATGAVPTAHPLRRPSARAASCRTCARPSSRGHLPPARRPVRRARGLVVGLGKCFVGLSAPSSRRCTTASSAARARLSFLAVLAAASLALTLAPARWLHAPTSDGAGAGGAPPRARPAALAAIILSTVVVHVGVGAASSALGARGRLGVRVRGRRAARRAGVDRRDRRRRRAGGRRRRRRRRGRSGRRARAPLLVNEGDDAAADADAADDKARADATAALEQRAG